MTDYTYDQLNRLTKLVTKKADGTIIASYTYTLDLAGNRTKVEEHSGRVVEYDYDDTHKLLKETISEPGQSSGRVISYTYDAVGNRLTKTDNGLSVLYQYDKNNRLFKEGDIIYQYDDNGNLIEKDGTDELIQYSYNQENRLIRAETTAAGVTIVVTYAYDARGNRVKKTIDGLVTTRYLVDENTDYAQVLEERDGTGSLRARYVYGHDLLSQTRNSVVSYYHTDGLGSTRTLTNSAQTVTDTYTYDAFGNLLDKTGVTVNDYLYTGEFFDANIGFYYLHARYMNPALGRFVTQDSFDGFHNDPYSLHKYLYAHANPVNHIDPSGYFIDLNSTTVATNEQNKIRTEFSIKTVSTPKKVLTRAFPRKITTRDIQINVLLLASAFNMVKEVVEFISDDNGGDDDDDDDDDEKVDYFRVQGGKHPTNPNKRSHYRIKVNANGTITIENKKSVLYVSRTNLAHAIYYRNEARPEGEIVAFKVPRWFDNMILEFMEPQENYRERFPKRADRVHPLEVDRTTSGFSIGLNPPWIEWLEEVATDGKVIK